MKEEEGKLAGAGGVEIYWRGWIPDTIRGVCLISHGLGEHIGRYAGVAEALCKEDVAAFGPDHRGHGKSGGKRGHVNSFSEYTSDLDSFRGQLEERFGELPIFLLGHSMGGLIAATYATTHSAGLDGLILSSAALRVEVNEPAIKLAVGRLASKLLPSLTMGNGLDSNFLSHDQAAVKDYNDDPLVHDRVSARWFTEFTAAIENVHEKAREINVPVLVMQSEEDRLVAPRGAEEFFDRLTVEDKTLKIWEGFYHEMFNEVEKEKPISTLVNWIVERVS